MVKQDVEGASIEIPVPREETSYPSHWNKIGPALEQWTRESFKELMVEMIQDIMDPLSLTVYIKGFTAKR